MKPNGLSLSLLIVASLSLWSCAASPGEKAAQFISRGKEFMAKRDYKRANLEFRNAVKARPNDAESYYQVGLSGMAAGNLREAAGALRRATEIDPKHAGAQLQFAGLLIASRDRDLVQDAGNRMKQVLEASPGNPQAMDALATSEAMLGNTMEASQHLETLLKRAPDALRASTVLADLRIRQKDFAGAEKALQAAVAAAPQSADALAILAWFHVSRGQNSAAETEVNRALELQPQNLVGLLALGASQSARKRTGELEGTLKTLSLHQDRSYEALYGTFLFEHGKRDEAVAEFKRLAERNPQDRAARQRLLNAYMATGRAADAETLINQVLESNPKDSEALVRRSEFLLRVGKVKEAEADIRRAIGFVPDSGEARLALAKILRLQGLAKTERQELTLALELNPELLEARSALARGLTAAGEFKAAITVLDQAPPRQQDSLAVIAARNWIAIQQGNAAAARPSIDRILKAQRVPEVVLQDGYVRILEKDYDRAMADAEELLRAQPDDPQAARLLAAAGRAQRSLPETVQRVRRLVAVHSGSAPLKLLLGDLLASSGDRAEARKAFEAAKAAAPESAVPDIALAQLDFKERRFEEVRKRMAALTAVDKHNSRALLLLANASNAAGNRPAAMKGYRDVLEFDPANLMALNNLAYLMAYQNPDEALAVAQKAMAIAPDSPGLHDTLGWVYYRKASYPRAIEYLEMAVRKDPTPTYEYHLGKAYVKAGDENRGIQLIANALQKNPDLIKSEEDW